MKPVLVDTCIWSVALRSTVPRYAEITRKLVELINTGRALMIGPIRQELLSGYSVRQQILKLKSKLEAFPDEKILSEDFTEAAECSNTCRAQGIQGSHIDFLICAVAIRLGCEIFTTDKNFENYQQYLPVNLYGSC